MRVIHGPKTFVSNLLKRYKDAFASRGLIGKAGIGCATILLFLCSCSLGLLLISNPETTNENNAVTQSNEVSSTTSSRLAAELDVDVVEQTSDSNLTATDESTISASTPEATSTVVSTETAEPISTISPAATPEPTNTPLPSETPTNTPQPTSTSIPRIQVKNNNINVRNGPGTNYIVIYTAQSGEEFEVIAKSSGWLNISLADGTRGWVAEAVVDPLDLLQKSL